MRDPAPPPLRRWWRRRGLRARLTTVAVLTSALGLALAAVVLAGSYTSARLGELDRAATATARQVAALADGDTLPSVLPLPVDTTVQSQVLDGGGAVIAASPGVSRSLPLIDPAAAQRIPRGRARQVGEPPDEGAQRVVVLDARLRGQPVTVLTAVPLHDVFRVLRALRLGLLVGVPASVLLVGFATWLLVGSALRPVEALRSAAERLREARDPPLPVPLAHDEVHRLADTLNTMLARLAEASARERRMLDDAAHELRSPLTSLQVSLEVALAHPNAEPWAQTATDGLAEVRRMARLVDDLLVLARLDAAAPAGEELVDLTVLADADGPPLPVRGDAAALRRALGNLRANAERHAQGRVEVTACAAGRLAEVLVSDDGHGIALEDRERVFDRFTRLDDARSRDIGGTGLGLAIARATARAHGGDVTVRDGRLGGATLVLSLPLAGPAEATGPLSRPPAPAGPAPAPRARPAATR